MQPKSQFFLCLFFLAQICLIQSCRTHNPSFEASKASFNIESMKIDSLNTCESALEMIQNIHFLNWKGLPADCDWSALTGDYPTDWNGVPVRSLGTNFQKAPFLTFELEGYMRPSIAFVEGIPTLFEAMGPKIEDLSALLEFLGEPAAKLDWDFGTLPFKKKEFVFPEYGITLFLNTDLDKALHIALYPSTSLKNYLANLRPELGKKRIDR